MASGDAPDNRIRCAWDGDPAAYPDFMRRVRLAFERTPRKKRHLLGPEVVAQLSGKAWIVTQDLDHRLLVRRNGVIYLLEYLHERLGRTPVPDVGTRLENLILRIRRPSGQSMSTWSSQLRYHYRQLQVALGRVRKEQDRKDDASTASPSTSRPPRSSPPSTSSPRRASRETQEEPQGEDDADEGATVGPPEDDRDELLADEPEGRESPTWRRSRRKAKDRESDSDDSTHALADMALWERYDESLPDVLPSEVLGWLLLRRAGISHQASLAVQSAAANSLRLDDIEKSLRAMEDEILGQELRPRGGLGPGGKGHGRHRTYWVEESGEWAMWLGENGELDELFDGGEVHYVGKKLPSQVHPEPYVPQDYYEDWNYYSSGWDPYYEEWETEDYASSWWYEDLPPEQHKELEEAYALLDQKARNFVEARQAVKARNLSRGFYPYAPSTKGGSFKGKKGKGKGKPKGKGYGGQASSSATPPVMAASSLGGQTDDGSGFLGAAVGDAGYTGCFICGNKNHDFRHCPKRQGKGSAKGAVHFASEVGTIYQVTEAPTSSATSATAFAIEEQCQDDEIFSSEAEDLSGYAVLDSGATETVASLPALEALMGVRRSMGTSLSASSFQVLDHPPKRFKFGNGEFAASASFVLLPQQIGDHHVDLGVYTLDVVGVPVLIGIKTMMRLHAIVDFAHCRAVFAAVDAGLVVPLKRSRSGHLLVSLKDNWLQQGHRMDARTVQPEASPFVSKEGPASSFMVQGTAAEHVDPVGEDQEAVHAASANQAPSASKQRGPKKQADPLDEERSEGPDPRDPRAKGSPCYGNHRVAKAYKGSVSGANQFGSWTGCEVCKIRLSYTPRMGCHGIHRKSAPLARDVQEIHKTLPPDVEAYPTNREISLTAAENSALARLESLRRLRKGSGKASITADETANKTKDPSKTEDQSSKTTGDPSKTGDQSSKTTGDQKESTNAQASTSSSPVSPGTIVVDPEELPKHHSRKASRPNDQIVEVEDLALNLTTQKAFDYQSMERLISQMQPNSFRGGRQATVKERKGGFSIVFGLYAHGSYYGCTRDSERYPAVCRYLNECVRRLRPDSSFHWTSLALMVNMRGAMHLDAHNEASSSNLAVGLGPYGGGELWVELRDGDPSDPALPLSWREVPGGKRVPGQVHATRHHPTVFSPKRYHKTLPWTGTRYTVIAYTARSWPEARRDQRLQETLQSLSFVVPSPTPSTTSATRSECLLAEPDEESGHELTEEGVLLTLEDREAILSTYEDFESGLKEIFLQYPNEKATNVVHLCSPWLAPLEMEHALQREDWSYQVLSHGEGCDLATNGGFHHARDLLTSLKPEWLWCHVPRGPPLLFADGDNWPDPKQANKAKRYLKVLRHVLLLSRDHVLGGGKLIWFLPSTSAAGNVREVQRFWNHYGKGPANAVTEGVLMFSNVMELCDLPSRQPYEGIWATLTSATTSTAALMLDDATDMVLPVDTSCLETLTTTELDRLMHHVHQLHRRFGHPSNRLFVKNLIHRNADEKVIAAASKLECDECLESQIKMPSPAVNLDKCEKLWSCLQVDGFHLRCGDVVYHFLLMVDEASGFAVVREMFSHPEEDHRNMSGPEVVHVLQEAWFQYFGYPDTLKLDLEGALRSKVLREACADKGIDLIPAPAEYHEMIADVEREIGYVRQHLERFLRGGAFERPGQAALAAVAAHNTLARVHGFSPLQWALGRDMSLGNRAHEASGDAISSTRTTNFAQQGNLRLEAERSFLQYRADQLASRAKNAKVRTQVRFFPGDMIFYRRYKSPADLPANSWIDRPRLRGARWYGPGRVLACETKVEEGHRKPSQYVWAICSGRLKKFHSTQLRHASASERLTHEALRDITMPWTLTSLTRLMEKGSYDDETRSRASRNLPFGRKKRGFQRREPETSTRPPPPPAPASATRGKESEELLDFPSDEEMIPDPSTRKAPRLQESEAGSHVSEAPLDVNRLLHDPRYLPAASTTRFQEQRRQHEQDDRPWHVQQGDLLYTAEETESGIYSVILDMPANDREWKKVLKDPRKFLAKSVQKGVEVSWHRLDDVQRAAMTEAKKAEVDSWISNKVVKAALPHITRDQALRMRWIYTFKAAEPGKVKAKARMVILGYSDPSLLDQETSSPAMSRQSKMLFFNYATARRWRVLAGDVKTAFLQAKAPDRRHPLHAQPLPELAAAMNLSEEQMVELLGSAYGLTSAPREWFQDLTSTLRKLQAVPCLSDPCIWRLFDASGQKVVGLIGLYVDDILFCGDEACDLYCSFLHDSYAWSPWESDNFSHCGVRVQQFADASILLDHSEYCAELVQMPARAKGDDGELTPQETSQARAILGSIQWRASQTAPQHSAKVSYLLSMLATRRGEVVDMVNKLVREVHSSRHTSVRIQQLECDPSQMIMIGWSDAAVANRPDLKSTGGHLFGLMNPEEFKRGHGKINAITWKSGKLQRVARSSLSAETQALADLDGDLMFARMTWAEMNGAQGELKDKEDWIRSVPATMVIDARALYDSLERGDLTISNMKDKFSALETLALAQSMTSLGTQLQWTDSDHQLADGAFMSAKKRRALEAMNSSFELEEDR
ncbi:RE1 [Symbiodinium necroappetens]|uniref:RE1 protein n=1 Tax=Symbiodinium necroappetens TaxID=1628268 RepID=A0A812Q1Y5_9DINO|nr:RE1 [Symbiodinium necroappetens]